MRGSAINPATLEQGPALNTLHTRSIGSAISVALIPASLALTGCASESIYWTQQQAVPPTDYVFIAPYFAEVKNRITVTIAQGTQQQGGVPTMTIVLTPVPASRSFVFLKRNSLFNNAVNLNFSSTGMLSGSDSSSQQQVTVILTELAQITGGLVTAEIAPGLPGSPGLLGHTPPPVAEETCSSSIKDLVSGLPFVWSREIASASATYTLVSFPKGAQLPTSRLELTVALPSGIDPHAVKVGDGHAGIVAFFPVPSRAELRCVPAVGAAYLLATPSTLNLYLDSAFIDPKRDFLSNPQDAFTFTDGFLTGHKYSDQSPVKTVVDTITAPIRALLPSVSVTQTTQVQTGGGKPDQTTTTSSQTTTPPKQ